MKTRDEITIAKYMGTQRAANDVLLEEDFDDLVLRASEGDRRAVGAIAIALGKSLVEEARSVVKGLDGEAEDVVQDFLLDRSKGTLQPGKRSSDGLDVQDGAGDRSNGEGSGNGIGDCGTTMADEGGDGPPGKRAGGAAAEFSTPPRWLLSGSLFTGAGGPPLARGRSALPGSRREARSSPSRRL